MTKTLLGFGILILLQFISNLIINILPIKFPAPILGMVILVILLQAKIIKEEWIKNICELLLKHMALLFIPLFVGIIVYFDLIKTNILPILIAIFLITTLIMVFTALFVETIIKFTRLARMKKGGKNA
ncbi:MAG: CidA/LrgA family protein [Fusobacterium sp.]|nr:CidA/LrgA family protein [Fusobacterium sp.]